MREAHFFNSQIAPRLKSWGTYDRLENGLSGGIPDTNYALNTDGVEAQGWLETKIVHSGKVYFEKFQLPWIFKRSRYTPNSVWVIATDEKQKHLWLWGWETLAKAPRTTKRKWTVLQMADLESAIPDTTPWPWSEVKLRLAGTQP